MTLEEQFDRLIRTLQLIEREPWKWDVAALEVEFGVGRATVERDIRILRRWGTIQRKKGCFALKEMKFLPSRFTASEALALTLAAGIATERIGMPPTEAMKSALAKISIVLPERVEQFIKRMRKRVSVGVNLVRECNSETLDKISKAISCHNPLDIVYYVPSRNELTRRRVDPYGLTFRLGAWYLIGKCHLRNETRTFGVDRIRSLRVVDDHFKYPKEFDLEEYLSKGWQLQADARPEHVVLRFSPIVARWVSGCTFHPQQRTTKQRDGSLIYEVTVAGIDEIKHWILGFGDQVEVLEPESLRRSVADTAQRIAALYSSPVALAPHEAAVRL